MPIFKPRHWLFCVIICFYHPLFLYGASRCVVGHISCIFLLRFASFLDVCSFCPCLSRLFCVMSTPCTSSSTLPVRLTRWPECRLCVMICSSQWCTLCFSQWLLDFSTGADGWRQCFLHYDCWCPRPPGCFNRGNKAHCLLSPPVLSVRVYRRCHTFRALRICPLALDVRYWQNIPLLWWRSCFACTDVCGVGRSVCCPASLYCFQDSAVIDIQRMLFNDNDAEWPWCRMIHLLWNRLPVARFICFNQTLFHRKWWPFYKQFPLFVWRPEFFVWVCRLINVAFAPGSIECELFFSRGPLSAGGD